ncbi:MAG: C4-dicarboxylate ABC transporter substrate-binding protein [Burkholderiales bacterium]|nr:C4-dicarboxylate ABC transporter substrate-binding protein [Burkholderiales bacterium]
MLRVISNALISIRDLLVTALPFILLGAVLLVGAYLLLEPAPPKRIVFATGPEQGALAEFGERYATELSRHGIEVELLTTRGSLDNLEALGDSSRHVDVGFVQGGSSDYARTVDEKQSEIPLVSLGSMFFEPVWLFYRDDAAHPVPQVQLPELAQREHWRISFGADGSGTPGLMRKLLAANRISLEELQPVTLDLTPAVVSLLGGELDAVAFVSAPESPMAQMLLQTPGVRLLEFGQSEAYSRRFPFLSPVVLPRGVADLERNVPEHDIPLIAPITSLIARKDTHPALIQLLVQAATRIHSSPGWIARAGQFPTSQAAEFPLAPEAERFYLNGPPFLQLYLPFWLANLIDRMWVVLFSIIAVMIPLSRVVPPLVEFRLRRRIFRWYRQLREIETRFESAEAPPATLLDELARLEIRIAHIAVPLSHTDALYNLRSHISLVRRRLRAMPQARTGQ